MSESPRASEVAGRVEWIAGVALPAAILCGLNVLKPLVVDDSAYYAFAVQIARSPFDPYGFDIYWYEHPQSAFTVLAPPVLPFWWAASIQLFGDEPWIAKLWLAPWCLILAAAAFSMAKRLAPQVVIATTWMIVLSPSVLPSLNLMLDVPALALSLAALAMFLNGHWTTVVMAGLLAGLAMQTKYTTFVVPLLFFAAAVASDDRVRRFLQAIVSAAVAGAIFGGWELLIAGKYGQSHFLYHSAHQPAEWVRRDGLISPLIGLMGGIAAPLTTLWLAIRGFSWRWLVASAVIVVIGLVSIAAWPRQEGTPWTPTAVTFGLLGVGVAAATLGSVSIHVGNAKARWTSRFLIVWLAIELAGYFALTPWPAVRRVIGLSVATTLAIAGTAASTVDRRKVWFAVACSLALAAFYQSIEIENGLVERDAVAAVNERIHRADSRPRVWFVGHRGWQHYAERSGWTPLDPRQSDALRSGDWLVLPDTEFAGTRVALPNRLDLVDSIGFHSRWKLGTIPWFYGTNAAVRRRDRALLTVDIHRIR